MTKKRTRTDLVAELFLCHPNQWISARVLEQVAKRSDTQELSRCRQKFGMTIEHSWRRRGKTLCSGWTYIPAKRKAA